MAHSTCSQSQCQCALGYYQRTPTLCEQFELGTTGCESGDCGVVVPHSECSDSRCVCSQGYVQNGTACDCVDLRGSRCVVVELGVTNCISDSACQRYVSNSKCSNATDPYLCRCQDGYATVEDRTQCQANGLESTCTGDVDCVLVENSTCSMQRLCSCREGFETLVNTSTCVQIGGYLIHDLMFVGETSTLNP